jgi:NADPH:quinone reductase-like Zn-dependent oxidoreductase
LKGNASQIIRGVRAAKDLDVTVRAILTHADQNRLSKLGESVARGELELPIGKSFPLSEVREAQRAAEGHGAGKVLLLV